MKDNKYFLNTALAVVLGIILLVCVLVRTFAPAVILPQLSVPNVVLVSLGALLLDHYVAGAPKRCYWCVLVLSAVTFGLLPYAGGFVPAESVLTLALLGGGVFTAVTWIFTSIMDRLSTGPAAKAAPVLCAFGLFLAAQCFAGM
jgi:hypothetical protein